uniref:Uncharacterized protein n=1 Tax=Glossina pallidipes TaxID=7398 RepID=A0A1A9Z0H4_GLOPL
MDLDRVLDAKLLFNLLIARYNLGFIESWPPVLLQRVCSLPILECVPTVWAPSYKRDIFGLAAHLGEKNVQIPLFPATHFLLGTMHAISNLMTIIVLFIWKQFLPLFTPIRCMLQRFSELLSRRYWDKISNRNFYINEK